MRVTGSMILDPCAPEKPGVPEWTKRPSESGAATAVFFGATFFGATFFGATFFATALFGAAFFTAFFGAAFLPRDVQISTLEC